MIVNSDAIIELDKHLLPEMHCVAEMFANFPPDALVVQAEVAPRLAAAEGRALGEEVKGCPHLEPLGGAALSLDLIDAEPQARPRQPAGIGDRLLDQPLKFGLRSFVGHRSIP